MVATATMYEDSTYLARNPTWHQEDSPWKARQIHRLLAQNSIQPSSVCEVGCGAGEVLRSLAGHYGSDVTFSGYEISSQAYEICVGKETQNVRFFLEDLLARERSSFDVVLAIDVIEHVEDVFGFLRRLRPHGTYKVFHIPLDLSVQSVLRGSPIMRARHSVGHLHTFVKETALAALEDTGYQVLAHSYTKGALDRPGGWKARLLKLPRTVSYAMNRDLTVRVLGGFSLLVLAK